MMNHRLEIFQNYIKPDLFLCFAHRALVRIFVELNVTSRREPYFIFIVLAQEDAVAMDDEHAGDEIDLFIDVRHTRIVAKKYRT